MTVLRTLLLTLIAALAVAGCQSGGGDGPALEAAMPTDTHDNCSVLDQGATFLSGGGGESDGVVRLGMSECGLIGVLGQPESVAPAVRPGAARAVTMTYRNPDGTGTAYVFENNALKEINRVAPGQAAPGQLAPGQPLATN